MDVVRSQSSQGCCPIGYLRITAPHEADVIDFEADDEIDGLDMTDAQCRAAMAGSGDPDRLQRGQCADAGGQAGDRECARGIDRPRRLCLTEQGSANDGTRRVPCAHEQNPGRFV